MNLTGWDSKTGLPIPPVDMVYNATGSFWVAVGYACFSVPVLIYALLHVRERKGRILLLILLGGTLCAAVEPFADVLGGCWHPEVGQPTVFRILGRGIPPWVCIGYFTYFGAITSVYFLWCLRGITRKVLWVAFLAAAAVDIGMENIFLHYDLYRYYGNQPLNFIGKLPFWWPPINALGVWGSVVALFIVVPHLKGSQLLLVPFILPIVDLTSYALIAYPGIVAVNKPDLGPWLTHLAGVLVWVLAFVVVRSVSYVLAADSPLRQGHTLILPLAQPAFLLEATEPGSQAGESRTERRYE